MITIDGSMGEGGGQLLRSSLTLSLLTQVPFRITNIRARRARPGLMRQHLTSVNAATAIGDADVVGARIGSTDLTFRPKAIRGGDYAFAIDGAGSTTLVLQTILLPLLLGAAERSRIVLEGGTHNPMAPPLDFLALAFLPLLLRMGARATTEFERYGFYPAGGGRFVATVDPFPRGQKLARLELLERGETLERSATAVVAEVPPSVALRELDTFARALGWDLASCKPRVVRECRGPGNVLLAIVRSEHVTEVFAGFGERGVRAESVAESLSREVLRYLEAGVPVGEHLADQLLLPMALGSGGTFRTLALTEHARTQMDLLRTFVGISVHAEQESRDVWRVEVPFGGV